jgi:hypothetical protein
MLQNNNHHSSGLLFLDLDSDTFAHNAQQTCCKYQILACGVSILPNNSHLCFLTATRRKAPKREVATECLVPAALAQAMYLVLKEVEH